MWNSCMWETQSLWIDRLRLRLCLACLLLPDLCSGPIRKSECNAAWFIGTLNGCRRILMVPETCWAWIDRVCIGAVLNQSEKPAQANDIYPSTSFTARDLVSTQWAWGFYRRCNQPIQCPSSKAPGSLVSLNGWRMSKRLEPISLGFLSKRLFCYCVSLLGLYFRINHA